MLEVFKNSVSKWNRYNRTVSQLNALSNRDLTDIGVSRADIARVAREATRR